MNLDDLIKLAGVAKSQTDTPVQEQPDATEGMRTMIALVTPEQLNKLTGEAPVAEEMPGEATTEPDPQPYEGPLGSPADLSLRRYLGANGQPVNVDETKVYEDHKVEDITEAWNEYKTEPVEEGKVGTPNTLEKVEAQIEKLKDMAQKAKDDGDPQKANMIQSSDEMTELLRKQRKLKKNESIEEAVVDEDDVEEDNAFNSAAANAKKAGKKNFTFNGKSYPVKIDDKTADALTDSVNEGAMKQAEIEVQDWVEKYDGYTGVNGDSLPEGYLQAMLNTGIVSDAFDQDEYIAFNEKNGYENDGDWDEDDHDKFMAQSPITSGMFSEIRAIQKKYGIDEQGVNDIMGYFESVNRMKTLAGI